MHLRAATPSDAAAIRAVETAAFGRADEADLVEALVARGGAISLVAEEEGAVVGHLLLSPIAIASEAGVEVPALALAPMAVAPPSQRGGVGSALVRAALDAARAAGHRVVVVLGHPAYYPRFGFVPAARHDVRPPVAAWAPAFFVLALVHGALDGVAGTVRYPPPFGVPT